MNDQLYVYLRIIYDWYYSYRRQCSTLKTHIWNDFETEFFFVVYINGVLFLDTLKNALDICVANSQAAMILSAKYR